MDCRRAGPSPSAAALREHEDVLALRGTARAPARRPLRSGRGRRRQRVSTQLIAELDRPPDCRDRLVVVDRRPSRTATARRSPRRRSRRSSARARRRAKPSRPHVCRSLPLRRDSRATCESASSRAVAAPSRSRSPKRPRGRAAGTRSRRRRSASSTVSTSGMAADRVGRRDVEHLVAGEVGLDREHDRVAQVVHVDVRAVVLDQHRRVTDDRPEIPLVARSRPAPSTGESTCSGCRRVRRRRSQRSSPNHFAVAYGSCGPDRMLLVDREVVGLERTGRRR